jgi:hypothetical protein
MEPQPRQLTDHHSPSIPTDQLQWLILIVPDAIKWPSARDHPPEAASGSRKGLGVFEVKNFEPGLDCRRWGDAYPPEFGGKICRCVHPLSIECAKQRTFQNLRWPCQHAGRKR